MVPVAAAILVIIVAIVVICAVRGKSTHNKGELVSIYFFFLTGTIQPEIRRPSVNQFLPWLPEWLDLNIIVPVAATIIVLIVGVIVICVAISRRTRGPEQTRLRGNHLYQKNKSIFKLIFIKK